jgi:hypothetical protein
VRTHRATAIIFADAFVSRALPIADRSNASRESRATSPLKINQPLPHQGSEHVTSKALQADAARGPQRAFETQSQPAQAEHCAGNGRQLLIQGPGTPEQRRTGTQPAAVNHAFAGDAFGHAPALADGATRALSAETLAPAVRGASKPLSRPGCACFSARWVQPTIKESKTSRCARRHPACASAWLATRPRRPVRFLRCLCMYNSPLSDTAVHGLSHKSTSSLLQLACQP